MKLGWINPSAAVYEDLIAFLKKRLEKGHGETVLALGVSGIFNIIFKYAKHTTLS